MARQHYSRLESFAGPNFVQCVAAVPLTQRLGAEVCVRSLSSNHTQAFCVCSKWSTNPPPFQTRRLAQPPNSPFDRATVERFRQAFPRARWSDSRKAWFVPGRTASKRISSWLARIEADADAFADEKGRDAYAFDPLSSPYLEANSDGLRIRTPFSRTVLSELREVPFSRWDGDMRVWHVPYRSIDDLRRRWPDIEAAAHRNEPAVKKERLKAGRGSSEAVIARARAAERQKKRYPVPPGGLPPLDRPIATSIGIVLFEGTVGELADSEGLRVFYPDVLGEDLVWVAWRRPDLDELVAAWPARTPPSLREIGRGWWVPTIEELRPARREAKARRGEARRGVGKVL
jgi:hypothetical protein